MLGRFCLVVKQWVIVVHVILMMAQISFYCSLGQPFGMITATNEGTNIIPVMVFVDHLATTDIIRSSV